MASRSDWSDAGLDGMLRLRASRQLSTRRLHDLFDPNRRRTPAQPASQVPTTAMAQADTQATHPTSPHSSLETDTVMTDADQISPLSRDQAAGQPVDSASTPNASEDEAMKVDELVLTDSDQPVSRSTRSATARARSSVPRSTGRSATDTNKRRASGAGQRKRHLTAAYGTPKALELDLPRKRTKKTNNDSGKAKASSSKPSEQQDLSEQPPEKEQDGQPKKARYAAKRYIQKSILPIRPTYLKKTNVTSRPSRAEKDIYLDMASSPSTDGLSLSPGPEDTASDHELFLGLVLRITGRNLSSVYSSTCEDKPAQTKDPSQSNEKDNENKKGYHGHLDGTMPPLSSIDDIYGTLAESIKKLPHAEAVFGNRHLRIFTMCSGTEAPVLAMTKLSAALRALGISFGIYHVGSVEIEPFKQAFIEANSDPEVIFRDVVEFDKDDVNPQTVYGAKAHPPQNIDILVAGSSCVDYSGLNVQPKAFAIEGESYATMRGIAGYCKRFRPKIVILENVKKAPWQNIKGYWETIDYVGHAFVVDSKDFGTSQTRQRGYMFAIDTVAGDEFGFDYQEVFAEFRKNLSKLQRRATSPYTAFTTPMDELAYDQATQDLLTDGTGRKGTRAWSVCKLRYDMARVDQKLGFSRPVTFWQNNGVSCPPDFFGMRGTLPRLGERVMESLDLYKPYYLVDRGYDVLYKARAPDVSQNADRETDPTHWGIMRCITPHGLIFDFLRGGLISGRELLVLQGLSAPDLRLDIGNSKQLTDLAGNAMTGTVVGAVMAAAISVSYKVNKDRGSVESFFGLEKQRSLQLLPREEPRESFKQPKEVVSTWEEGHGMTFQPQALQTEGSCSKGDILETGFNSRQLCLCEGYSVSKNDQFYICKDCGHTVCSACKGNPKHKYDLLATLSRETPQAFVYFVEKRLPKSLTVDTTRSVDFKLLLDSLQKLAIDKDRTEWIAEVIESHYHYNGVKRSRDTKVEFLGPSARLELRLSPTSNASLIHGGAPLKRRMDCEWHLFATCSKAEPAKSRLRDALEVPIARMKPDSDDILSGTWELRVLAPPPTTIIITGEGQLQPSYEARIGITDSRWSTREEFTRLGIQFNDPRLPEVVKFELTQDCAAPHASIYKSVVPFPHFDGKYVYLLLDAQPLQPATEDRYVITTDPHRRNNFERRSYSVALPRGWRMNISAEGTIINGIQRCEYADSWKPSPAIVLQKTASEGSAAVWVSPKNPATKHNVEDCEGINAPTFSVMVPLASELKRLFPAGTTFELDLVGRHGKFQPLEWLLSQLDIPYSENGAWQELGTCSVREGDCHCAPSKPSLTWYWTYPNGKKKKKIIKPFEDFKEADAFEQAQKLKPFKAAAVIHCFKQEVYVAIHLAPQTLVHEVAAVISRNSSESSVAVCWRAVHQSVLAKRPSFDLQILRRSKAKECSFPACKDVRIDSLLAECYDHDLLPKRKLLDHQVLVVAWALHQEAGCTQWSEMEQRDVHIPPLRLSLEAQAAIGRDVRGGVIADHVGAGKTISALAIFAADLRLSNLHTGKTIRVDPETGRIPTDATLVVVPKNLVAQWYDQAIDSCDGESTEIMRINSMNDVLDCNFEDFMGAKFIIISNEVFNQAKYWKCLRTLAYAPNVPFTGGRAFGLWLSLASGTAAEMFKACDPSDSDLTKFLAERKKAKDTLTGYEKLPAFRERKDYKASASHQVITPPAELDLVEPDPTFIPGPLEAEAKLDETYHQTLEKWPIKGAETATSSTPRMYALLHFFSFRRVIVDEFQYLQDLSLRAVMELSAKRRWLLSATPPIHTLQGVNVMARLLGTKINNGDIRPEQLGASTRSVGIVQQQSHVEEFLNYKNGLSSSAQSVQHEQAYRFLRIFVRQNPVPLLTKEVSTFVVYNPTPADVITYYETMQAVLSESIIYGKSGNAKKGESRPESVKQLAQSCDNAVDALIRCTTLMRTNKDFSSNASGEYAKMLQDHIDMFVDLASKFFKLSQEAFALDSELIPVETKDKSKKAKVVLPGINSEADINWRKFVRSLTDDDVFEDRTVALLLSHVMELASKSPITPSDLPSDLDRNSASDVEAWNDVRGKKISACTKVLKTLVDRLVKLARVVRFAKAILDILNDQKVICGRCHTHFPARSLILLVTCGHMVCRDCREIPRNGLVCFEKSCKTMPNERLMPSASTFGFSDLDTQSEIGSRMYTVAKTIKQVLAEQRQPNQQENKILVFAQHQEVIGHLKNALTARKISFIDATSRGYAKIKSFQEDKTDAKVLILQVNTEDAAGWNLQMMNHVMFVTPVVADSQHAYNSMMTQAKGRALRYGNKHREVKVWHFAMANTMDINVLEDRMGIAFVRRGGKQIAVWKTDVLKTDVSLRGPGLLGEEVEGDENEGEDGGSGEGEGDGSDAGEAGA